MYVTDETSIADLETYATGLQQTSLDAVATVKTDCEIARYIYIYIYIYMSLFSNWQIENRREKKLTQCELANK